MDAEQNRLAIRRELHLRELAIRKALASRQDRTEEVLLNERLAELRLIRRTLVRLDLLPAVPSDFEH
jgi:hypothetical protein